MKNTPGATNPRAKPFVGFRCHLTKLHQAYGAKAGQLHARRNQGKVRGFPPILQLQTQSGCNASCVICPQQKIRDLFPDARMTDSCFQHIVQQCISEDNLRGVGFTLQNEPLMDPAIFERIRFFRDHVKSKALTLLVTNGTLLTPELVPRIMKSGLDVIHISCNGYGKKDYEAVNKGKSWEAFRENLDYFLAQDLSHIAVLISFVRTGIYDAEFKQALDYWRRRGFRCFIHGINNRGGVLENYDRYARPLRKESLTVRIRKKLIRRILGCCPYPFLQMSVLATGKVLICTHDWGRRQIIGDLNHQTIREVWNGTVMRKIRQKHLSDRRREIPSCEKCDVFENVAFG